jgi:uncharacterized membrane protein YkoI
MKRTQAVLSSLCIATSLGLAGCQAPREKPKAALATVNVSATAPSKPAVDEQATARPKTDLLGAIDTACKSAPEAQFVVANLNESEDKPVYQVVLLGKGKAHIINVDATDGRLLESQDEELEADMQEYLDRLLKLGPGVGIEKAIASALAEIPGSWARFAEMREHETEVCYGVMLMQGDQMKNVLVSMKDGKVLQVTDAEEEEDEDGMEMEEQSEPPAAPPK